MGDGPERAWKGLSEAAPVFIGYERAERMVAALLDGVCAWRPEAVVGVLRGGLVPATMVACALGLKLALIGRDAATGAVAWVGPAPVEDRVLLVDDSCSTGATLRAVSAALRAQGFQCATLAIVHDPEVTDFVPDFSHPMRELFRLPWERGEATPPARALRAAGVRESREAEAPFVAIDLDGVLPDGAGEPFGAAALPPFVPERAVMLAARPERERAFVVSWLAGVGQAGVRLECRPDHFGEDAASRARFMAWIATKRGCTHFVACHAERAVRVAALAPHLLVSWWSVAEVRGWTVAAVEPPSVPPGGATLR